MRGSHQNRLKDVWPQSLHQELGQGESPSWKDTAARWQQQIEHRMGDHPRLTLAVAAGIGFLLGWIIKRK
jgi:ElaB/YqjD/DUF883 family membrane-anchored ribosome-binding protein